MHAEIIVPPGAPSWATEREALWNTVQRGESHIRAQYAREMLISLPHEVTDVGRVALVRSFVTEQLATAGMVADFAIHRPDREADPRNHHGHVLLTMRTLDAFGFAKRKAREWNTREFLLALREEWAEYVNRALERFGAFARVTHLSNAAIGLNREAEPKVGMRATALERVGVRSHAGNDRRAVIERNALRALLARGQDVAAVHVGGVAGHGEGSRSSRPGDIPHGGGDNGASVNTSVGLSSVFAAERAHGTLQHNRQDFRRTVLVALGDSWKARRTWRNEYVYEYGGDDGKRGTAPERVVDQGSQLRMSSGTKREAEALVTLAEAKGWTRFDLPPGDWAGKDEFLRSALARGFEVASKDAADLDRVERIRRSLSPEGASVGNGASWLTLLARASVTDTSYSKSVFTQSDVADEIRRKFKESYKREPTEGEAKEVLTVSLAHEDLIPYAADGKVLYTTKSVLKDEMRLEGVAGRLVADHGYPTSDRAIAAAIEEVRRANAVRLGDTNAVGFSPGQEDAFRKVTGPERLAAVIGYAGTGKSFMLGQAKTAWEAEGYVPVGAALSGIAASELQDGSNIPSSTIDSFLNKYLGSEDRPARETLPAKSVIVIDEAGMVGSRKMADVFELAEKSNAKLVLVGDFEQLQSIERGSAFKRLVDGPEAVLRPGQITEVNRQRAGWQKQATIDFAEGRTEAAMRAYDRAGLVHGSSNELEAKRALIADWAAYRAANPEKSAVILAYRRDDVWDLNQRSRETQRAAGTLGAEQHRFAVDVNDGGGRLRDLNVSVGDPLYFLENNSQLNVKNGTIGTITGIAVDDGKARISVEIGKGEKGRVLEFSPEEYRKFSLAYAATVHKTQGITRDAAFAYADRSAGFNRHLMYVGASRHKDDFNVYYPENKFGSKERLFAHVARSGHNANAIEFFDGVRERFAKDPNVIDQVAREMRERAAGAARSSDSPAFDATVEKDPGSRLTRTLHQLRRDFDAVVRTSRNLRDAAYEIHDVVTHPQRAVADLAHKQTLAWRASLEAKLNELQRSGVTSLTIERVGRSLDRQIDAASRSIDNAVARIREFRLAPEVAPRAQTPEAGVPRSAAAPRSEATSPADVLAITAVKAAVFERQAQALLMSRQLHERLLAVTALTGRRPSELLTSGAMLRVDPALPGHLSFEPRGDGKAMVPFPVIGDPKQIIGALDSIRRDANGRYDGLTSSEVAQRIEALVRSAVVNGFGEKLSVNDVRGMYAAVAYEQSDKRLSNLASYANVLNYDRANNVALSAFGRFTAAPNVEQGVAEYRRGLLEVGGALREQLGRAVGQQTGVAGADVALEAQIAALRSRLRGVEALVPARGAPLEMRTDLQVLQEIVAAQGRETAARLATVEKENAEAKIVMPATVKERIEARLAELQVRVEAARAFTPAETVEMRVLNGALATAQERGNAGSVKRAQDRLDVVRAGRDAREEVALRDYKRSEATVVSGPSRVELQAQYEREYAAVQPDLAAHVGQQALIEQLRGERDRLGVVYQQIRATVDREGAGARNVSFNDDGELNLGSVEVQMEALSEEIGSLEVSSRGAGLE